MPDAIAGTEKVAPVNVPPELVVVVPLNVTGEPLNVAVNAEFAANADPEIVTVEPEIPDVGLSVIAEVAENVAAPEFEFASVITTV